MLFGDSTASTSAPPPDVILQYQGQSIYGRRTILELGSLKLKAMFDDQSTQRPMTRNMMPVYILDNIIKGFPFADVCYVIKVLMKPPLFCLLHFSCMICRVLCGVRVLLACGVRQFGYTGSFDLPFLGLVQIARVAEELGMTTLSYISTHYTLPPPSPAPGFACGRVAPRVDRSPERARGTEEGNHDLPEAGGSLPPRHAPGLHAPR
jgi:hypothetical protein